MATDGFRAPSSIPAPPRTRCPADSVSDGHSQEADIAQGSRACAGRVRDVRSEWTAVEDPAESLVREHVRWSTRVAARYRPCRYAYPRRRPGPRDRIPRGRANTPGPERRVGRWHAADCAKWHVGWWPTPGGARWGLGGWSAAARAGWPLGRWRATADRPRRQLGRWSAASRARRQLARRRRLSAMSTSPRLLAARGAAAPDRAVAAVRQPAVPHVFLIASTADSDGCMGSRVGASD